MLLSCWMYRSFRNPSEPSILSTTPPTGLGVLWRRRPPWLTTTWSWTTCWVSSETSGTPSVGSRWRGEMRLTAAHSPCWTPGSCHGPGALQAGFGTLNTYLLCLENVCSSSMPRTHSASPERLCCSVLFTFKCSVHSKMTSFSKPPHISHATTVPAFGLVPRSAMVLLSPVSTSPVGLSS